MKKENIVANDSENHRNARLNLTMEALTSLRSVDAAQHVSKYKQRSVSEQSKV